MKAEDQRARAQAVPDRIGPDDPRYAALVGRGFNKRFAGKPDYVRLVHSADDVILLVAATVVVSVRRRKPAAPPLFRGG
jgi:hypothetical protein